jgi:hypothetical protein
MFNLDEFMFATLLTFWVKRYHLDTNKLWKQIIDHKYNTDNLNMFACSDLGASPFWKGVLSAARAIKMGYRWKVENGRKITFGKTTGLAPIV